MNDKTSNTLMSGLTLIDIDQPGIYVLLERVGTTGWRCLVLEADPYHNDMERDGATTVISANWLRDVPLTIEDYDTMKESLDG